MPVVFLMHSQRRERYWKANSMSVLALDLGEKRTGIAVSNLERTVAHPHSVMATQEVMGKAPAFRRVLDDYAIELFVVGLPVSLDGTEHAQAGRIRNLAKRLTELYGLPVEYADERLSSAEAKSVLRQMGYSEREMRGRTDKIAACIFLQTWLDAKST